MKKYVTIPNILSLSRLFLLPLLYVLVNNKNMVLVFVICYAIVGSTDYFDGLIARKFNMTSEIGKRLDSFADIFFYVSSAYFLAKLGPEYLAPNKTMLFIFFGILALSFVISGVKLKQPMMMHTIMLKLCGVLVYFLIILTPYFDTTIYITILLSLYFISFAEEIIIFFRYKTVDPDAKSLYHMIKEEKGKSDVSEDNAA